MRALLLAPHHDDETLFASFICLRYQPLVVICYGLPEVNGVDSRTRSHETAAALTELDIIGFREWPLSDSSSTEEEVEAYMWMLRNEQTWDLVFAPAVERDGHPQHNVIGRLADVVFNDVHHYTTYTTAPLRRTRNLLEISYEPEWLFQKHAALACHRSAAGTPSFRHFAEDLREYAL